MGSDGESGEIKKGDEVPNDITHAEDVVRQKEKKSRGSRGGSDEDEVPTSPDQEVIQIFALYIQPA